METNAVGDGVVTDTSKPHCSCMRCRVRGLIGPVMVITLGILFLIAEYSRYSFGHLWPILLIVAGVVLFIECLVPRAGHIDS
jgi:hypothetical protein